MKSFEAAIPFSHFLDQVKAKLQGRSFAEVLSLEKRGSQLFVIINKMGKSEIQFDIRETEGRSFTAELAKESIAFAHRMFRKEFEEKLQKLVESTGAKVSA